MADRFINDDFKVKAGGRKAVRITPEELKEKLRKAVINSGYYEDEEEVEDLVMSDDAEGYAAMAIQSDIAEDDMKYLIDHENVDTNNNNMPESLIGLHTLDNGLTFVGAFMGGDWETGAFIIVYYDGKKIRRYIPTYGNLIHVPFKSCFGSEQECENYSEVVDKLAKEYKKLGLITNVGDDFEDELPWLYFKKYGITPSFDHWKEKYKAINWDAVKYEIEQRIVVS